MKLTEDEIKNLCDFFEILRKVQIEQEKMTEEEKKNNAIKMGDIFY